MVAAAIRAPPLLHDVAIVVDARSQKRVGVRTQRLALHRVVDGCGGDRSCEVLERRGTRTERRRRALPRATSGQRQLKVYQETLTRRGERAHVHDRERRVRLVDVRTQQLGEGVRHAALVRVVHGGDGDAL